MNEGEELALQPTYIPRPDVPFYNGIPRHPRRSDTIDLMGWEHEPSHCPLCRLDGACLHYLPRATKDKLGLWLIKKPPPKQVMGPSTNTTLWTKQS